MPPSCLGAGRARFGALHRGEPQHEVTARSVKGCCYFLPPRRLGHKLEGVLCDGESDEVVASTVVNCTKIDESECETRPVSALAFSWEASMPFPVSVWQHRVLQE